MEVSKQEVESALTGAALKKTATRIEVLTRFIEVDHAQSYFDLQNTFAGKFDKSTLYRTLGSFEEAGLLHRIDDASGVAKYALGKNQDMANEHAHFVCDSCQNTYCLNATKEPRVKLPEGFQPKHVSTLINGICPNC